MKTSQHPQQDSLAESLAEHWQVLHQVIRRRVPEAHVDDILQEVAIAAVRSESSTMDASERQHWLCRVAITQCAAFWRQRAKHNSHSATDDELLNTPSNGSEDPVLWLMGQESLKQVREALDALPADQRKLLASKIIDGKTYSQIAAEQSITIDAAEYRLSVAKRRLRSELLRRQSHLEHPESKS